jgi:glycosyltransferase involved in cell wall biosynthesis
LIDANFENGTENSLSLGIVTASLTIRAGGIYSSIREAHLQLARRLSKIEVYGVRASQYTYDLELDMLADVAVFPIIGPKQFGYAPKLGRALLRSSHDIIHQHGIWMYPSIAVKAWARQTGYPTIVSPHGMLDPWALRNSYWKKQLAWFAFEAGNLGGAMCLHALTRQEANACRKLGLENPIAVIPNGVTIPHISSDIETPNWARTDRRNVLLFLGRIHSKKGLVQLVRSWSIVKQTDPSLVARWVLAIAGWDDGAHEASVKKCIFDNNLQRDVLLVGPLFNRDKERALRYARAFILPSFSEGLPVGVLEAWSFGLPVFMTRFCNLRQGFETGAAFEIETDPMPMARALSYVLRDESALQAAGQRGRELVERCFGWNVVTEQFISLYKWLVKGGSSPVFVE